MSEVAQPTNSTQAGSTQAGSTQADAQQAGDASEMPSSPAFREIDNVQDYAEYRSVSRKAALSVFILILSVWGIWSTVMLFFAVLGVILAVLGLLEIRKYPNEYSGLSYVQIGLLANALIFVGGLSWQSYVYATEVPEGYERISFKVLQATKAEPDKIPPDSALELNGKQVFVKGYVHPGGVSGNGFVTQFVLVPDMKTCCFGDQPAFTDMIEVTLPVDKAIKYNMRKRKLTGTLKVSEYLKPVEEVQGVFYQMKADDIK